MSARTISIFGATGSVGTSTLDLVRRDRDAYDVQALTANDDIEGLAKLACEFGAKLAVIADEDRYDDLKAALSGTNIGIAAGKDALCEAAGLDPDWTMAAIVGCAGLEPVMAAIEKGKTVALANKESLVSAGALMMAAVKHSGATLLPVDSEHNALFQCLSGGRIEEVRRLILTASGGPFRDWTLEEMCSVTPDQAVAHPNWDMGAKISVDSATMMNKGLELIEAYHLFAVGEERIDILVHPQSVVHSMVEYKDCSTLAQLGPTDMKVPIASALAWPARIETGCGALDLAAIGRLDFEAPDELRFPALRLARAALRRGGTAPATLNAANEIAVAAFLQGRIGFLDIAALVERVLDAADIAEPAGLQDIFTVDRDIRARTSELVGDFSRGD
ncbi:1-deoxy-D-xylulose-5-phosphate reductoisomerase [Novosphingopyxis sp.]|uniref:1-deoxy-D-xylulose-5-phosphate reductoisomerase n=1 Tax=Novosphingopyxis sp. TaxID=2709690 RepID=UPI003B5C07C1